MAMRKARTLRRVVAVAGMAAMSACASHRSAPVVPVPLAFANWSERVVVVPPRGWMIGNAGQSSDVELEEFVPAGQTIADWSQKLTVVVFRVNHRPDVDQLARSFVSAAAARCRSTLGVDQTRDFVENSHPVAVQYVTCGQLAGSDAGQAVFSKFIAADLGYATAQWSWRYPPVPAGANPVREADMAAALRVVASVTFCDKLTAIEGCSVVRRASGPPP